MLPKRYVSLFTGAGGLDIGLEQAGFKAISLCEIEKVFCDTLHENQQFRHSDGIDYFHGTSIINADICDVSGVDLAGGGEIDLVVGGPPCQAFSSSGKQLSVLDARGKLVHEFLRIIEELKPKMFLFENVRGLVTARDSNGEPGGVILNLLEQFFEIGYSCRSILLNSADYGSHQRRVRCFILGCINGKAPIFPEPTHQKDPSLFHAKWKSLGEFLANHADMNPDNFTYPTKELAKQLEKLPDGKGIKSIGKAEPTRPGGHWGYRQGTFIADKNLPARTVTGSASQDWVRYDGLLRRLTLAEIKLLQGFPCDWHILGTKAQKFKQVGNAVPTVFGELLGQIINKHLNAFPKEKAVQLDMPRSFMGYIDYTKRDHERNAISRSVHKQFNNGS